MLVYQNIKELFIAPFYFHQLTPPTPLLLTLATVALANVCHCFI